MLQCHGRWLDDTTHYSADIRHILVMAETGEPVQNEDGTTSETKTTGVYCVMGREAAFKPVSVLYSNENFALVKAEISSNQELLRLRPGDEVIVKAYDLYDGKVVGE